EIFERFDSAKYNYVKTFGNPTPLALAGLVMCLTPLSCQLMGWRGADGSGAANNGVNFFCGGVLMLLGGFLEFFLGNTFAFVVFCSYGGFFLSVGATLAPGFGALGDFENTAGSLNAQFYNTFAFFHLFVGLLSLVFLICSIRTNIVFVAVFLAYSIAFPLLAAADWQQGEGNMELSHRLKVGGGAACFFVAMLGWYAFLSSLLQSVDFPIELPMGDLSSVFSGASEKKK
ncbi:GPR1/FUN34/yaaH family-domain-containing protein, partial [Trichophaea hybrida]